MPTRTVTIVLSNQLEYIHSAREVVIADAVKYLAYADHTDTFGYHGNIVNVDADEESTTIKFQAPFTNDDEVEAFREEAKRLSRFESVMIV